MLKYYIYIKVIEWNGPDNQELFILKSIESYDNTTTAKEDMIELIMYNGILDNNVALFAFMKNQKPPERLIIDG